MKQKPEFKLWRVLVKNFSVKTLIIEMSQNKWQKRDGNASSQLIMNHPRNQEIQEINLFKKKGIFKRFRNWISKIFARRSGSCGLSYRPSCLSRPDRHLLGLCSSCTGSRLRLQ